MPRPRFRPAVICKVAREYGRVWQPAWNSGHGLDVDQVAWAYAQHRAAFEVRTAMEWNPLTRPDPYTLDTLAGVLGEAPSWLRRKLTGQVPADVGDLLGWARVLGPQVWPLVEGPEDLSLAVTPT
jgi:hypothetical protein